MKGKVGRNSREAESTKTVTVGHRTEGQQETVTSLATSMAGCAHAALGEPHLPPGWSWELSQRSGWVMWAHSPFPLSQVFFFKRVDQPANPQGKEVAVELPFKKQIPLSFSRCRCPQRYVVCVRGQGAELGLNGWWEEMVQRILLHCRTILTAQSLKSEAIYSGRGLEPMLHFQSILG